MKYCLLVFALLASIATAQEPEPTPTGPVMPDLKGKPVKTAESILEKAGITGWEVLDAPTREGVDTVIRQTPPAGTVIEPGSYPPKLYRGVVYREPRPVKAEEPPPPANPERKLDWMLPLLIVQLGVILAVVFTLPLVREYLQRTAPAETRAPSIQIKNRQTED